MRAAAVIFDLDDTLIVEQAVARESLRAAAAAVPHLDPALVETVVLGSARRAWHAGPHHRICSELGIASWEGLWATFEGCNPILDGLREWAPVYRHQAWSGAIGELGVQDPYAATAMAELYVQAQRTGHSLIPGAAETVRALAGEVPLALLTNGPADIQRLKLARTGLGDCFVAVGISGEAGVGKPSADAFARVLDKLNVNPHRAVMVGDSWERDIQGAVNLGMSAVWISAGRPPPQVLPGVRTVASLSTVMHPEGLLEIGAPSPLDPIRPQS